jgi:hypothetical protein
MLISPVLFIVLLDRASRSSREYGIVRGVFSGRPAYVGEKLARQGDVLLPHVTDQKEIPEQEQSTLHRRP